MAMLMLVSSMNVASARTGESTDTATRHTLNAAVIRLVQAMRDMDAAYLRQSVNAGLTTTDDPNERVMYEQQLAMSDAEFNDNVVQSLKFNADKMDMAELRRLLNGDQARWTVDGCRAEVRFDPSTPTPYNYTRFTLYQRDGQWY